MAGGRQALDQRPVEEGGVHPKGRNEMEDPER